MNSKCRFYVDIQSLNSKVTGSCHLCIVKYPNGDTTRFIVDCGLFQGEDEQSSEKNKCFPFDADKIDFVLVTHNHIDHIGRLPLLHANGYRGKIYTSKDTYHLLPLALSDSYRVLKDNAKRANENVLYSESDVSATIKLVEAVPYMQAIDIDEHIRVTFFRNGHLIGAALILVEISYPGEKSINWLFTGDYNNKNMFFDIPPLPQNVLDMPLNIMQESTYGDMDSSEIVPCFEQNIINALQKKSTIVVPVFSLGRAQEILYILKNLQDSEKIDVNIPIFFDGTLTKKYTNLYVSGILDIKPDMLDFLPKNLQLVDSGNRIEVLENRQSKIIVTSSGMGSYGPAPQYIAKFIKNSNALIHFTGYTAKDTMGSRIKYAEVGDIVKVGGLRVEKQAIVEYTTEFSAHAKAYEMIAFLQQFSNLNLVLVNHGDENTKEIFANRIIKEVNVKDVGVACRDIFFRVSPNHLIKTLTTKFQ